MSAPFTLVQGKKVFDTMQTSNCKCPTGCGTFDYKSRIPSDELQIRCAHCGKQVLARQVSNG